MYMSLVNEDMLLAFHNFGDVYMCDYLEATILGIWFRQESRKTNTGKKVMEINQSKIALVKLNLSSFVCVCVRARVRAFVCEVQNTVNRRPARSITTFAIEPSTPRHNACAFVFMFMWVRVHNAPVQSARSKGLRIGWLTHRPRSHGLSLACLSLYFFLSPSLSLSPLSLSIYLAVTLLLTLASSRDMFLIMFPSISNTISSTKICVRDNEIKWVYMLGENK